VAPHRGGQTLGKIAGDVVATVVSNLVCPFLGCGEAGGSVGEEVHSKSELEKLVGPVLVVGGGAVVGRVVRSVGAVGRMLGARGTQVRSHTLWERSGMRIDVENPNPGQRPGQIHFQEGADKYIYNMETGTFTGAPNRVNELLERPDVRNAIDRGFKYLGEE
jgi:hypothetical protein